MKYYSKADKVIILFLICISIGTIVYSATGTPSTLIVKTDSVGALVVSPAAPTPPYTTTVFNNTRFKTDSNGNLLVASSGGSGSPGGANTNVQFNNSGAFGGDAGFTYNSGTQSIFVGGNVVTDQLGTGGAPATFAYSRVFSTAGFYEMTGGFSGGLSFGSGHSVCWSSATTNTPGFGAVAGDTGMIRSAAGVVQFNNCTPGVFKPIRPEAVQLGGADAKPTCNAGNRGYLWYVAGGTGVVDTYEVCTKDVADAYAWRTIY